MYMYLNSCNSSQSIQSLTRPGLTPIPYTVHTLTMPLKTPPPSKYSRENPPGGNVPAHVPEEYFRVRFDPRFPNQNQSDRCYRNFVDFHRCRSRFGDEYQPCEWFKAQYRHACPNKWIESYREQLQDGTSFFTSIKRRTSHQMRDKVVVVSTFENYLSYS